MATVVPLVGLTVWAVFAMVGSVSHPTACAAQGSGKKCGCPVSSGEKILIECRSVDENACGACSVVTASGSREGRPCVTLAR